MYLSLLRRPVKVETCRCNEIRILLVVSIIIYVVINYKHSGMSILKIGLNKPRRCVGV